MRNGLRKRLIVEILELDLLLEVVAIEQRLVHELRGTLCKISIERRVRGFTDSSGHECHRRESSEIDAGAHAIRSPELDVVSVVMGLEQGAAMVWVPRGNALVDAALGQRVHALQPCCVAGDLPVAKNLHDAAEL